MIREIHLALCFISIWTSSGVTIDGFRSGNVSQIIFGLGLGLVGSIYMRIILDVY